MSNQISAYGLSNELYNFALKLRPPSSELSFEQIQTLAKHSGYRIRGEGLSDFILFSINGGDEDIHDRVGIENGLRINWMASVGRAGLSFYPSLVARVPGNRVNPTKTMLRNLERELPKIGYQFTDIIPWPKNNPIVTVPIDLYDTDSKDSIKFMFLSEYKTKYRRLYNDLKQVFEEIE